MEDKDKKKRKVKKKARKKKNIVFKIIKIILIIILLAVILGGVALAGVGLAMVKTAPPLDVNQILSLNEPSVIYDDKEDFMDNVVTEEKRKILSLDEIPKNVQNAFINIEDERFEEHNGIDVKRIFGAIYVDAKIVAGLQKGPYQGASTITQQLIKNRMFMEDALENRLNVSRKVHEMYLALELEKKLSKDEILEAYLNTINLGGLSYGVETASIQYFNKSVKDLNLIESAFLAAAVNSPAMYFIYARNPEDYFERYTSRVKTVLYQMNKNGDISSEEYNQAINDLDNKKLVFDINTKNTNKMNFEWFSRPVIEAVSKDLANEYNYTEEEVSALLMNGGLKIYSTMNKDLQNKTQKIMDDDKTIEKYSKSYVDAGKKREDGIIKLQSAAVIMDYHTGEVKTIIGGRGTQPPLSYNRAASNEFLKPPGSSIKPLTVYGPAIDTKMATAATVIEDSPISKEMSKKYGGWNPGNSPNVYEGYIPLSTALKKSKNVVAVKLEEMMGVNTGYSYGEKFGINFYSNGKQTDKSLAALSLGELTLGTNPLTMAAAYGVFGNNGVYTSPILYTKVVDRNGKVILENKPENRKVLSPQATYIMYDLLSGPVTSGGTGYNARFSSMVRGKTGTSSGTKNVWFNGLTPYYSASVWIGYDKPEKLKGVSSNTAAGVWRQIMENLHKDLKVKDVKNPGGLVRRSVCSVSGKIATDLCNHDPRGNHIKSFLFIRGTVPTELCDIHVEAEINKENGLLATEFTPDELRETRVFIKRDYKPSVPLKDQEYVLPTEYDDTLPQPEVEEEPTVEEEPPTSDQPGTGEEPPVVDIPTDKPTIVNPPSENPPAGENTSGDTTN